MERMVRNELERFYRFQRFKTRSLKHGYAFSFDQEFYNQLTLKIGKDTIGSIIDKSDTIGRCYFYALLLAKGLEGATLVHGVLHRLDISFDRYNDEFLHAWVEKDGYVYDTTAKMIFEKEIYYERMNAEAKEKFPSEQLLNNITFVKLGKHAIDLRPALKSRMEKICREWKIPFEDTINNKKTDKLERVK
ncbi:MAG: hypothetical protein ACI4R8_04570 [Candidatus Caccovivens sp.]